MRDLSVKRLRGAQPIRELSMVRFVFGDAQTGTSFSSSVLEYHLVRYNVRTGYAWRKRW